jgi:uncharacterized protein (DUF1800 family)
MFQLLRVSGAHALRGYDDIWKEIMSPALNEPIRLMSELGNNFWAARQPNGFSDRKADWVSTEHMDRRIRIATLIEKFGKPVLDPAAIIERERLSTATGMLVDKGRTASERFSLLACSPEFMEV